MKKHLVSAPHYLAVFWRRAAESDAFFNFSFLIFNSSAVRIESEATTDRRYQARLPAEVVLAF
jgi:hypothetical protein